MVIGILAAALGLVIAAACIIIPQLVNARRQRPGDDDTRAYLKQTGRSPRDIEQGNARLRARQANDSTSEAGSGSGDA